MVIECGQEKSCHGISIQIYIKMGQKVTSIREIRSSFLDFFKNQKHLIKPSGSLIPLGDPTLLFTTAGMVPFKDYFAGIAVPPQNRIATVQKCFRTTDLEEVGKTKRHLSFFEMLGNFSFNDYFKKEAIEFAWEYTTNFLPFDKEQIWVSIFLDDDEAYDLWTKHIGLPSNRIVRLDKADNFWGPAGATGPCGPCSELYLDRGPEYSCHGDPCQPGDDGERFMEFWNLVFNQFDLTSSGKYEPLKQTGIDTGAGLERLATLVQGVDSVYDTDELAGLRDEVANIYQTSYTGDNITPIRVITDHIRALCFAMTDGILPSNESRGYVLRRMLRRALLFGRKIGQNQPQLYKLIPKVISTYGYFYEDLGNNEELLKDYIESEEKRFLQTMEAGFEKITSLIERTKNGEFSNMIIPGKEIFLLYDTFGFPPEMSSEMLENEGIAIEMNSFHEEMEKQRDRGKAAWKPGETLTIQTSVQSNFIGYNSLKTDTEISDIIVENKNVDQLSAATLKDNQEFILIAPQTPCYPESGGQLGDAGVITGENFTCNINDTQKYGDAIIHICSQLSGTILKKDSAHIRVDENRRRSLAKNHSSTHLLNASLQKHLGAHIKQSGSMVHPDYLRFDFTHPKAMNEEQIELVENFVNEAIQTGTKVETEELPLEQAKQKGAVMTFGEKYGDLVRVVQMGDYSMEFCGGTHVTDIKDIELFLITKESSPGAGNRRIEGLSGVMAKEHIENTYVETMTRIESALQSADREKSEQLDKLSGEIKALRAAYEEKNTIIESWHKLKKAGQTLKNLEIAIKKEQKKGAVEKEVSQDTIANILQSVEETGNTKIATAIVNESIPYMKKIADEIRTRDPDLILALAGVYEDKWNYLLATTKGYAEKNQLDLSKHLQKTINEIDGIKGGGGGKKEMAQGSGIFVGSSDGIPEALLQKSVSKINA